MKRALPAIAIAAAFLAVGWIPASTADTTILDLALGSASSSDFNDGAQGWSTSDVPPPNARPDPTATWEWGAPTSGPGVAASGVNVWATNLEGLYSGSECAGLATPPIDLTGASSASISFNHWRHMDQFSATSTFVGDAGVLMVTADGGDTFARLTASDYTTNSISSVTRPCFDGADTDVRGYTGPHGTAIPAPTYTTSSVDLSAFVGQTVQVVFTFGSNCCTHRSGWYLDDVATTVDGVTTVESFEVSDGGFTMIGTKVAPPSPQGWEQGVATVGPAAETPLFATNLDGDYGPNECAWVESEPFLVGPVEANPGVLLKATLSWYQWFRSSSTYGGGVVQVGTGDGAYSVLTPTGGYPDSSVYSQLVPCLGDEAVETGAFGGFVDSLGSAMVEQQADLTPFIGQTVTIRFLFASGTSTSTYEGWYVDDVNVDVSAFLSVPDAEDLVPGLGTATSAPGWTSGGAISTWAYGVTSSNPAGQTVFKTNLNGNHDVNECSYIESPPIPGALFATNPTLRFEHWHRIAGTGVNVPWVAGIVLVSGDGGATWQHVAMNDYVRPVRTSTYNEVYDNCLGAWGADMDGGAYGLASPDFYWSEADLSAYASSPAVQVRFAIGSDGTFAYEGWAVRAVELGGVKVL